MENFDRKTRIATVHCKTCNKDVKFKVPKDILKNQDRIPVSFRYIHGNPIHSLTIYLDAQEAIRGVEFSQFLSISPDVLDTFKNAQIDIDSEVRVLVRTMITAFSIVINMYSDEASEILKHTGEVLGEMYCSILKGNNYKDLISILKDFWSRTNLGEFRNINYKDKGVEFEIFDCFECSHQPNLHRKLCKFNEGFFKTIFELNLNKEYKIEEYKCKANGDECCGFLLKEL
ncbi:MAG: V4R domain-containing protein [Promethearchaeota archaeon]